MLVPRYLKGTPLRSGDKTYLKDSFRQTVFVVVVVVVDVCRA